jgi:hypothetical protein
MWKPCPLYPQKQTCAVQLGMSAKGQQRTSLVVTFLVKSRCLPRWNRAREPKICTCVIVRNTVPNDQGIRGDRDVSMI